MTEGTVTEPVYFDLIIHDLHLPTVRIKVQPGDASDPRRVIRTAERESKEQVRKAKKGVLGINEPARFDHVWAVMDTDVAVRNNIWNDVKQLAAARKVRLAHSTPCFEFWLLLHITGFTTRADLVDGNAAKAAVKVALGRDYSTNQETAKQAIARFFSKWPEAVGHAENVRRHHEGAQTPNPANPSAEVDLLARALNDSAPEHLRRLRPPNP
ncbi:MAG TPA: RloB family protein [Candidatus Acidoferrum sp.]|nr:RloB family protein [Candidatus Acidoferrum sp.]